MPSKKVISTISPYEGGAYGRSRSDAFGNADLRGSDSGLYPGGYDNGEGSNQRVMQSPRVPSRYFPEGEAGSRANPITDPQDLMDMDGPAAHARQWRSTRKRRHWRAYSSPSDRP